MCGEDALRGDQAVDVVRARLPADEDDVLTFVRARLCRVGVEDGPAGRRPGRGGEAPGDDVVRYAGVDHRVQEVVDLRRVDARDRVVAVQQPLSDHRDCGTDRCGGRALRGSGLEQVQPALLDSELDVLQVAVVPLEPIDGLLELRERGREQAAHVIERSGQPDARDDVLPLSVHQELAADAALARGGVAAEADAGGAVVALVPEDHLHHVHGRPELVRDLVGLPVHACTRRVPGVEDRADRAEQLVVGVEREPMPRLVLVDRVVALDQLQQVGRGQLDVRAEAAALLERVQRLLERVRVDPFDDLAIHLDQSPVRVVGEAAVPRGGGHTERCLVVEPEVEDRVHHPGHRDRSTGPNGDEQRVERIAEGRAGRVLETADVLLDLDLEPRWEIPTGRHVGAAGVGCDREAGGNRHVEVRHLGEPDALSAEQFAAPVDGLVERVDESRAHLLLRCGLHGEAPLGVSSAVRHGRSASNSGRGGPRARRPSRATSSRGALCCRVRARRRLLRQP